MLLIFCKLKKKTAYVCKMSNLCIKNYFELWKIDNYINDSKQRKKGWHYLTVKKLSTLLRGITCGIVIPSEKDNILEFDPYMKSDKMPCIIYADIESLIKKLMDVQTIWKILWQATI